MNIYTYEDDDGNMRVNKLPVYPSAKILIEPESYMDAVNLIDSRFYPCVYFEGKNIIIPEYYSELILFMVKHFNAEVEYGAMKKHEYATLAIKAGVNGYLVRLGDSIQDAMECPKEMVSMALRHPKETKKLWEDLYSSSVKLK